MKTWTIGLALLLAAAGAASADLLIGWDDATETLDNNTPAVDDAEDHVFVAGFSGFINDGRTAVSFQGSTDGTFGPVLTPAATATSGRYEIRGTGGNAQDDRIAVSITNATGIDYDLDALVFDFTRRFDGSPQGFDVVYKAFGSSNSLGSSDVTILSQTGLAILAAPDDLPDFSASIASLTDHTLGNGETAVFHIIGNGATGTANAAIDNIAISGTAIPEPGSLALLLTAGTLLMASRRKRR